MDTSTYWSSTGYDSGGGATDSAYVVSLYGDRVVTAGKGAPNLTWPVRGDGTGGAVRLPRTGQARCSNAAGATIACAGTGQDGDVRAGAVWPSPRFTNADGSAPVTGSVVVDQLTGLMWTRNAASPTVGSCSGDSMRWQWAFNYVACLNGIAHLGYTDWRLPNVRELESLRNPGYGEATCFGVTCTDNGTWLNAQGFTNAATPLAWWTSTTWAGNSAQAWAIWSWNGQLGLALKDPSTLVPYVWPVRGP